MGEVPLFGHCESLLSVFKSRLSLFESLLLWFERPLFLFEGLQGYLAHKDPPPLPRATIWP